MKLFFKLLNKTFRQLPKSVWLVILLTFLPVFALVRFVDLTPQVDNDFFFSSDDPHFQADKEISQLFTRRDEQLIIGVRGNIFLKEYQDKIEHLSGLLSTYDEVSSVKSITHGPNGIRDALKSPLWKRLLIADNLKATNIIVFLDDLTTETVIPKMEKLIASLQEKNFQIKMSGFPYIVRLIRRHLASDLKVFSSLAFLIFGTVIFFIFRSRRVLLGITIACTNAWLLTLICSHFLEIKIGMLTANLITIIIVLTLSHIVFLTFNWRNLQNDTTLPPKTSKVWEAMKITFPASFWSMVTTLLGFVSLLFVPAKPLRELGISGSIGTLMAIIIAYGVYPLFLPREKDAGKSPQSESILNSYQKLFLFFEKYKKIVVVFIGLVFLISLPGLFHLDTDPSLISYFSQDSEIGRGLNYMDRNGGSSPLILVLKTKSGEKLITNTAYEKLWSLQEALEEHEAVGTIISLPVLMAETKRSPLTFFLTWNWLLEILEKPEYDRIATSFITGDREYGLFLLRMHELNRSASRYKVIKEINEIVDKYDFELHLTGGVYALQGQLSKLVTASLIFGLGRLILLFAGIAYIISRCLRTTLAMTVSIGAIPLCILGGLGLFKVPLDVISSPAANVAIAMGIDSMIHMAQAYRRLKVKERSWVHVREILWQPVLTAMFIICAGFGIFFFSAFPPTQRFGGAIAIGSIIAGLTALFIFPLLTETRWERIPLLIKKRFRKMEKF